MQGESFVAFPADDADTPICCANQAIGFVGGLQSRTNFLWFLLGYGVTLRLFLLSAVEPVGRNLFT
jgi:hypothetical protein